jgi:choline kinase
MGERLKGISGDLPKPLTPIDGIPLLERIIRTGKSAGVEEFIIILGYKREAIQKHFAKGAELGISIKYIVNYEWEKGNGLSAYKAKEALQDGERFLLLMSDHLFNREMLESLIRNFSQANLLAVDTMIDAVFDLEDATKVVCDGRMISAIGKNLSEYNGIDCGMFRLKTNFFSAMEKALAKGKDSLSDGVRELIVMDDFQAHFITPNASGWM